jgi:hypothetical protein
MPLFTNEEIMVIKETIKKLNQQSAIQALEGIASVLTKAPTLKASLFEEIIDDAFRLTNFVKGG